MASSLIGQTFPEGVTFQYVPYSPEKADLNSCGIPIKFEASKEFKENKVVLVAVPGAFTRTCSEKHIPTFVQHQDALKAKGVDKIIVIAYNESMVMSAWGKANGVTDDYMIFASDTDVKFSKSIDLVKDDGRTQRYALIVDHGKITYAGVSDAKGVIEGTDAASVLAHL
ncbi:peroxiredoxin type-2 [Diaporthe australafricana]|uniref:Peroxiredoxin type-2 n=1 Tax=Diaporthe australafricana TaxID=127596 RepID=A0ABR3VUX4_9PEZI